VTDFDIKGLPEEQARQLALSIVIERVVKIKDTVSDLPPEMQLAILQVSTFLKYRELDGEATREAYISGVAEMWDASYEVEDRVRSYGGTSP
jgi:hypothetical protein